MWQALKMAMKSVSGNKLRACLTMLGIVIGVFSLVVLVSLVSGATGKVTDTISSLGSNMLTVTITEGIGPEIQLEKVEAWGQETMVGAIAPVSQTSLTGKYEDSSTTVQVYGTTPDYHEIQGLELMLGRFLKNSDVDNHTYVCVLSEAAAETLVGYADCLGHEISLNGVRFDVVGVLAEDDSSLTAAFTSGSAVAYVPYTTLPRVAEDVDRAVTSLYVAAADNVEQDMAEARMENLLLEHFDLNDDAFSISSTNAIEEAMTQITDVLGYMLGGIASISLVVGGIGIMNIMLVTVTERTREIGIRKAIGASRGRILLQFLMESVVLSLMGCAMGIFFSWALLQILSAVLSGAGMSFTMNGTVVAVSVGFCLLIGLIFGLYPANKAAKMPPIEALRYAG